MTARLDPHITGIVQRRAAKLRRRPLLESKERFSSSDEPSAPQRAALIAARDGGMLARQKHGRWTNLADGAHLTGTIDACRRRGWVMDAPGYENAMKPSWTPVVITTAGRVVLTKGE